MFGISIIPQNIITGQLRTGSAVFIPEIFDILPRNLGLSSEPANFAFVLMPGVYLALNRLLLKEKIVPYSKNFAYIILISVIIFLESCLRYLFLKLLVFYRAMVYLNPHLSN